MTEFPKASEVYRAAKRLRSELEQQGMLLAHDGLLPSATRCVAGVPIRGSWWGHPAGKLIYEALQRVELDIARVKLVAEKSTLVHRRLWPALAAVARARAPWQTAGLTRYEQELLARVDGERAVRVDRLPERGPRAAAELAKMLELRLLVFAKTEHTESGKHAKILLPFAVWQEQMGLADNELPEPPAALESLTAPVRGWVGERAAALLPWPPARESPPDSE